MGQSSSRTPDSDAYVLITKQALPVSKSFQYQTQLDQQHAAFVNDLPLLAPKTERDLQKMYATTVFA